jgi:hypothetical protein
VPYANRPPEPRSYFVQKALQCRRLASSILDDDRTHSALISLAEEFEAKAASAAEDFQTPDSGPVIGPIPAGAKA